MRTSFTLLLTLLIGLFAGCDDQSSDADKPSDQGLADARSPDAARPDARTGDVGPSDAAPPDGARPDARPGDIGPPDARLGDAAPPDARAGDAMAADAMAPDAAPADAAPDAAPDAAAPPVNPLPPRVDGHGCVLPEAPPLGAYVLNEAFPALDFDRPLWIGVAPGDPDTLFVVEQGGVIWAFDNRDDVADRAEFLRRAVYRNNNEEGLLGLAFHPEYAENGRFYIYYSANGGVCPAGTDRCSVLAELRRADRRRADPASERRLLVIGEPYGNHNGGDLHFGPDGLLYVGVGDGGSGGDPRGNGQNPRTLLGSILRIDVDGAAPYGIPADNPFADGVGGAPEIYTWGMRNPWRMRFDGSTGALWVGDVGQNAWEEVDKIVAPGNFGWNVREGFACYGARQCADGFEEPIWVYDHNDGLSITGGPVYRGPDLPELWGSYLFADYSSGRLWALRERPPAEPEVTQLTAGSQLTSFGEDADGRVYLTSFVGRRSVLRLDRAAPPMGPEFPRLLSETGCFADTATHALAPGVVPYGVNRPLWSDGATKLRFVALPPGESARYVEDEAWQMPVGTVLIKTFLIDEAGRPEPRRLETRMYTREAQAWRGYTWRWNEDQTDAVLLDGAFDEVINTPDGELLWHYPSRVECDQCHTAAAGFALGWRTRQLNGRFDLDGIGYDQIAALSERGYLEGAPAPAGLPAHARLGADAPAAEHARAALDVNCAQCHRPGGGANARIDLRASVPLAAMGLCDVEPGQGDLDLANARLIAPGGSAHSVLLARMQRRDGKGMPPLATRRIDEASAAAVQAWIEGIAACP